MDEQRDDEQLLDYRALAGRLALTALVLGAATFVAVVVQGLQEGLSFRLMGRWLAVYVAVYLLAGGVLTAAHALQGARRARRRGGRLGSSDVGLTPRRPEGRDGD